MDSHVVIADIVRSGFVEGHHYGSAVVLGPDGSVLWKIGDVGSQILPRSCNKPIQALGMVRAGLDLTDHQLALACASHSGEQFHLDGVREILAGAGLDEGALQNTPDWPLDEEAQHALIRAGGEKSSVAQNCSGKHSAMLATCVINDWPLESYLDPKHPLQQAIATCFAEITGEQIQAVAVDGCGAPLLSTSLTGLARAFSRLATATTGPEHEIAEAIRTFPEYVSGTKRDEVKLLRAIPGAIGKAGAESCYVLALPDGRAVATKTSDGAARARPVLMAAILKHIGADTEAGVDTEAVRATGEWPLLGHGEPVGEIRAVLG